MRLVVARCTVDYAGRLTAHLPPAPRLIMVKADGCVADPRRRRRLQAAELDERAQHGDRVGRRRRPGRVDGPLTQGRDAHDHARTRSLSDTEPRAGRRPRAVEGRRRGPPAGAAGRQLRRHRPRAAPRPPRVPDRHRPRRPAVPRRRRATRWRSRSSAGARSTGSSSWPATSSSSSATRMLRPVRGVFVAQQIKPQARVLADPARHRLRRGRLRRAAGHRARRPALF